MKVYTRNVYFHKNIELEILNPNIEKIFNYYMNVYMQLLTVTRKHFFNIF